MARPAARWGFYRDWIVAILAGGRTKGRVAGSGLGTGYSSIVVGRGRLFTIGRQEAAVVVTALAASTGHPLWTRTIGETSRNCSSTPTLDVDHLYALDPDGELVCLRADTGEVVWQTSFVDDYAGRMMSGRGYGESPLIDGDRLICTPGGPEAALVALDKLTGAIIWKSKLPELGPQGRAGTPARAYKTEDVAARSNPCQQGRSARVSEGGSGLRGGPIECSVPLPGEVWRPGGLPADSGGLPRSRVWNVVTGSWSSTP